MLPRSVPQESTIICRRLQPMLFSLPARMIPGAGGQSVRLVAVVGPPASQVMGPPAPHLQIVSGRREARWRLWSRVPGTHRRPAIVLISGAGKTTVEFLSTATSTRVWRLRSCSASGCAIITSAASELAGRECLAFGSDDLGALLALGLGLAGHRSLHALGQLDIAQLDDRDLDPPRLGLHIEDLADVLVDLVGLRQRLIQGVTPDHRSQRVCDLADRLLDVSIATTARTGSSTR